MKTRARITMTLEVDLDMVPGFGDDPVDFTNLVKNALSGIKHYNPELTVSEIVERSYIWDSEAGKYNDPDFTS